MKTLLLALLLTTGPDGGAPAVEGEGFQKTRWGMTLSEVQGLYPTAKAAGAKGNLEVSDASFAGERSRLEFSFADAGLTQVSVQLKGGRLDREAVLQRCLRFRELLTTKYGGPSNIDLRWKSARAEDSNLAQALASGQLAIRVEWITPSTLITLSCERAGGEVVTGLLYSDRRLVGQEQEAALKDL